MGRKNNHAARHTHTNFSALEATLQRSWDSRRARETRRAKSFFYLGRTLVGSGSVIEELETIDLSCVIQANGELVIPLMNRKSLRMGTGKEILEKGVERLIGMGAVEMEVKLGDPFPKQQVRRNPDTGLRPHAIRVPLIDGREEIEREQMIVANYLGRDISGFPLPNLRVAEAASLPAASEASRVIRQSLPPVVVLSAPTVLEFPVQRGHA